MSESADVYKILEVMGDRMTDLQKSYRVLNDAHVELRVEVIEMKTKLTTVYQILTFFVSPTMALILLAEFLRIVGVI